MVTLPMRKVGRPKRVVVEEGRSNEGIKSNKAESKKVISRVVVWLGLLILLIMHVMDVQSCGGKRMKQIGKFTVLLKEGK